VGVIRESGNVLRRRIQMADERDKKFGTDEDKPEDVEAHKKYALGATDEGKADPAEEENDVEAHQRHQNL
jgi:hypothetical protein